MLLIKYIKVNMTLHTTTTNHKCHGFTGELRNDNTEFPSMLSSLQNLIWPGNPFDVSHLRLLHYLLYTVHILTYQIVCNF